MMVEVTGVRVEVEGVRVEVEGVQIERRVVAGAGMEVGMEVEEGDGGVRIVGERVVVREVAVVVEVRVVEVTREMGEGGDWGGGGGGVWGVDGVEVEVEVKCILADRNRWDMAERSYTLPVSDF